MGVKSQFYPVNLLSHDKDPNWKVARYPFTDVGAETIAVMQAGYLVKFSAALDAVLPALAADDAALAGVIVDLPDPDETAPKTVLVLLQGSLNENQVHYANAHAESPPSPLSAAAVQRLRDLSIYLDPAVPTGAFSP